MTNIDSDSATEVGDDLLENEDQLAAADETEATAYDDEHDAAEKGVEATDAAPAQQPDGADGEANQLDDEAYELVDVLENEGPIEHGLGLSHDDHDLEGAAFDGEQFEDPADGEDTG